LCTTEEQKMVYAAIDDAGGDGIWSGWLVRKLNMHESVLKTTLKHLTTKGLIKSFKSVEAPNKRMYIKASIRPSEKATGGPWYTDQNLDEAFIEDLQKVIFDFIKRHGTYLSKHQGGSATASSRQLVPKKGVLKGSDKGKKRAIDQMSEDTQSNVNGKSHNALGNKAVNGQKKDVLLPLPAGYIEYPTVRDIAKFISQAGITTNTILSEEDVQKLVDVLVYDGLVERIRVANRPGYRATRIAKQGMGSWASHPGNENPEAGPEPLVNGYTEAPCGKCPVFDLCEEGGPVGPSNCEYFQRWLGLD
jgi:DNA-directed RNA polymerase III subunit RPC6